MWLQSMSLWLMQSIWWKVQTACASIISIVWHWQSADVSVCLCAGSKTECLVLDQTSLFQRNPTALKHLDSNKYSGKNIYTTQTLYLHVKAFIINSLVFFSFFSSQGQFPFVSLSLPALKIFTWSASCFSLHGWIVAEKAQLLADIF